MEVNEEDTNDLELDDDAEERLCGKLCGKVEGGRYFGVLSDAVILVKC